ncbi:MAG: hypothetical protein ACOYYS_03265 [Chloroflexota bacterium]
MASPQPHPSHTSLPPTPSRGPSDTEAVIEPQASPVVTQAEASPTHASRPSRTPLPAQIGLDPLAWESWPVVPIVPQNVRDIYWRGQALGNNPQAFSVFGDCQSLPDEFLGIYETDPKLLAALPLDLQLTLAYFAGSPTHAGPTTKDSSTAGAMLWPEWHENQYTCQRNETPMDCELRIHNPSFVFVTVGTHYEVRNELYMRIIVEDLMAKGIVPILATKADNREGEHEINRLMAALASEYNLPLWNFWAATQDLPGQGLISKESNPHLGAIYFDVDAKARFRLTALQSLHAVWQAVTAE